MLDIKFIRENKEEIKIAAVNKNIELDVDYLLELDDMRKEMITEIDNLRAKRNNLAKINHGGKPSEESIQEGKSLKDEITKLEEKFGEIDSKYLDLMVKVPTIPSPDTPVNQDDSGNVEILQWGDIQKFNFEPKTHIELAESLDIVDFEKGTKVAGYRGYYLKGDGALLVMALMMYALDKMAQKGFTPFIPPTLVKSFPLFGSGYFKGREYNPEIDEIYQVSTPDKDATGEKIKEQKFLIGTAEPALLAYFSDQTFKEEDLPIKVSGFSPCYRSEIGSYGKDTKGLYRVHEFMKIEQVVVSRADVNESNKLQDEMLDISKELHEDLKLPYRILSICTGDMAAGKYRAFDIEAWMPGMNRWGETGSASNFVDWQSRRLNIRYVDKDGNKKFVHLLNDTALPSVRPFIAIIENYQQADGSIIIPEVLRKYMGGREVISKK